MDEQGLRQEGVTERSWVDAVDRSWVDEAGQSLGDAVGWESEETRIVVGFEKHVGDSEKHVGGFEQHVGK